MVNTNQQISCLWSLIKYCYVCFCQVPTRTSVFINEPKLSDFKQVLTKEGLMAEFSGGVLVCNNLVAIRKVSRHLCWRLQLQIISFSNWHVCVFWRCLPCLSYVCTFCVCGPPKSSLVNPLSAGTVFRRQHLTSKDDPRTNIIKYL